MKWVPLWIDLNRLHPCPLSVHAPPRPRLLPTAWVGGQVGWLTMSTIDPDSSAVILKNWAGAVGWWRVASTKLADGRVLVECRDYQRHLLDRRPTDKTISTSAKRHVMFTDWPFVVSDTSITSAIYRPGSQLLDDPASMTGTNRLISQIGNEPGRWICSADPKLGISICEASGAKASDSLCPIRLFSPPFSSSRVALFCLPIILPLRESVRRCSSGRNRSRWLAGAQTMFYYLFIFLGSSRHASWDAPCLSVGFAFASTTNINVSVPRVMFVIYWLCH